MDERAVETDTRCRYVQYLAAQLLELVLDRVNGKDGNIGIVSGDKMVSLIIHTVDELGDG